MNQPKYTAVLKENDYKNFVEANLSEEVSDFKEIFKSQEIIIFSGKNVAQNSKVLAYFGNLECIILAGQFSEMGQINCNSPKIVKTPYVKFLCEKMENASQFDSVWGIYREELIAEHNARVEAERAIKIEQAEQEYSENLLGK